MSAVINPPYRRSHPVSRGRVAAAIGTVLLLWAADGGAAPATVTTRDAPALSAPFDRAKLIRRLPAGHPACIVEESSAADPPPGEAREWLMVMISGGTYAYMRVGDLVPDSASATAAALCGVMEGRTPDPSRAQALAATTSPRTSYVGHRPADPDVRAGTFLPLDAVRVTFGLALGQAWLNGAAAERNHIATSGTAIHLMLGMAIYDLVSVSSSFGWAFPEDRQPFQQTVVPVTGGSPRSAESSTYISNYALAVGPRTPVFVLGRWDASAVVAAFSADYGWAAISGKRSIQNCGDCQVNPLDLPHGTFWRVGTDIGVSTLNGTDAAFIVTVSYQRYNATAGLTQELRFGVGCWLL